MEHTPFFTPWLPILAPMGRRASEVLTHIRQCTLSQLENCFGAIFAAAVLCPPKPGDKRRERPYSIRRTFWCFLWQMLNQNTSCREVVRQLQAVLGLHGVHNLDPGNSAYCQARARLPVSLLEQGVIETATAADRQSPSRRLLQGRPVKASDGSTVSLADTPENQEIYPQQKGQKPGCGFPIMRLSVLFSLQSGAVLQVAKGSYYQHELRLFHSLHNQLQANDILLYDRAGGHFVLAAQLGQLNVDLISRVLIRKIEWRSGKRLGKHDRLVVWKKGRNKPAYLTQEQWAALPGQITVRVLKVKITLKGCRTQEVTLVTTLLNPVQYPAAEIAEAYLRRWRLELCLDDLKTTLGMDTLHCLRPSQALKRLAIFKRAHGTRSPFTIHHSPFAIHRFPIKGTRRNGANGSNGVLPGPAHPCHDKCRMKNKECRMAMGGASRITHYVLRITLLHTLVHDISGCFTLFYAFLRWMLLVDRWTLCVLVPISRVLLLVISVNQWSKCRPVFLPDSHPQPANPAWSHLQLTRFNTI